MVAVGRTPESGNCPPMAGARTILAGRCVTDSWPNKLHVLHSSGVGSCWSSTRTERRSFLPPLYSVPEVGVASR